MFESLEQRVLLAVIMWDGGPDGLGTNFNDAANWDGDVLPGPEDDAVVPAMMGAPTITLGASITLGSLEMHRAFSQSNFTLTLNGSSEFGDAYTLSGGTLTGSGDVAITGTLNWSSGNLVGTGQMVIEPGAMMNISSLATRVLSRPLINNGTISWTAGTMFLQGTTWTNNGAMNLAVSGTVALTGVGASSLINDGTLTKSGPGTATWLSPGATLVFNNQGDVNVQQGTLLLSGDGGGALTGQIIGAAGSTIQLATTLMHGASSLLQTAGTLTISGGTHSFPAGVLDATGTVNLSAGTITFNDPLTPSAMGNISTNVTFNGVLTFGGTVTITGGISTFNQSPVLGSLSVAGGTVSVAAAAAVNLSGNLSLSNGTITGAGDVRIGGVFTWTGGTLTGSGQTVLRDTGALTITTARTTDRPLTVEGALTVGAGGTLNYRAATLTNSGTITLSGGGVIRRDFAGTSTLLNAGTVQTGAGGGSLAASTGTFTLDNQGVVLVNADQSLTVSAFANIASGTLAAGTWDVGGTLTLPSGTTISTIGPAASVRLSSPAAAINMSGGGSALAMLAVNNGELTLHDGAPFAFKPAGDVFTNHGTFNITGVGTVSVPSHVTFNNGTAGILGGTLNIGDAMRGPGPVIEFGPFEGGGTININGTVAFNQDFEIFAIVNLFTPGTLTGSGHILITGTFNWFGGAQTGTGSTSVGSGNTLNMFGDGVMTLAREMNNLVAGSWTGGCLLLDGGQFANSMGAMFTISGTVEVLSTGSGDESFSNAGSMALTSGSDVTFGTDLAVSNSGSLIIESLCVFEEDEVFDGTVELVSGGEVTGPGNLTFLFGFVWTGGTMSGTGTTTIDAAATFFMGDGNMTLSRTIENFSVAGSWTGGCLLMAGGIFNNNAGASLDIFADPRIDVLGISGTNEFNNHGLITVHTGEFVIGVPGVNSGTIIVIPPDTLIFMAPWIYLPGSSLEGPGGVVFGGGMHSFPDGAFAITGPIGLDVGASLVLPASSLPNYNAATNTFTGGSWTIGAGAQLFLNGADIRTIGLDTTFTLMGDAQLAALANLSRIDGSLRLEDGATLAINPDASGAALINNGHLRIGPGSTLDIAGSYQQASLATLHIGIAGITNALMGRLVVSGSAALGGSFELTYENGFAASRGEEFRVISSAGTTGSFSSITAPPPPGGDLKAPVLIDSLGVRHIVTHIADWNNDLVVDVPDIFSFLTAWFAGDAAAQQFGGTAGVPAIFAFLTAWFAA